MVKSAAEALALVRKHKVVSMTAAPGVPSLVGEIVGGPVRGSWWGHPKGGLIFNIANEVSDSPDVLTAKVVEGKIAFVHRSLWPSLYRAVTDPVHHDAAVRRLGPMARRVLDEVGRVGEVRSDHLAIRWKATTPAARKALTKARAELEGELLVKTGNIHTESGNHVTVLESWIAWASADLKRRAKGLTRKAAVARLRQAGVKAWD